MPGGLILDVWNGGLSEMRRPADVDLREDLQFPLTYQIADIREPQNRKSDSSKTVTVPGTRSNDRLFAQLFEIGADSTFDVNRRRDCWVIQDGIEVFQGSLRLRKITREGWNTVSYDTMMFGRLADLFSALKNDDGLDLELTDLDLSEWNHPLSRDSVVSSWVGDIIRGGSAYQAYSVGPIYPVTETNFAPGGRTYFLLGSTHSLAVGDVVRFEMDSPGSTTVAFDRSNGHHTVVGVDEAFAPSVTVNLQFASGATNTGGLSRYGAVGAGYVYPTVNLGKNSLTDTQWSVQDFVPGMYFKTVVDSIFDRLGFTYESTFFESDYFKRLVLYSDRTGTKGRSMMVSTPSPFTILSSSAPGASGPVPISDVAVDDEDRWDPVTYVYTHPGATSTDSFTLSFVASILVTPINLSTLQVRVYRSLNPDGTLNGSWSSGFGSLVQQVTVWNGGAYTPVTGSSYADGTITYSGVVDVTDLRPGEQVRVSYNEVDPLIPNVPVVALTVSLVSWRISRMLPTGMKARDFLIFLINAFNLYVEPDRANERNLIIEPFDLYYQGDVLDWTSKVDLSQPVEIEPVSPEMARNFRWSYQDDSDFHNKGYRDAYGETYGQIVVDRDNDFNVNTESTVVPAVAATPLVDTRGTLDLVIPTVVKDAQWTPPDGYKPRAFYFTGLRYCPLGFAVGGTGTTADFSTSVFGYAGHLDNPQDATLDLDFGLLRQYYYGGGGAFNVASGTLYERFYRRWLDELTDPETRRVTFSMKLAPTDLADLSFRRIYQIDGTNFRLQKIDDYNPITGAPCRVEFLKVKQAPAYNVGATSLGVGPNPTQGTGTLPPLPGDSGVGGNTVPIGAQVGSVEVLGTGNVVSVLVDAVQLVGYDNAVEAGSTILVIGTRNTVKS